MNEEKEEKVETVKNTEEKEEVKIIYVLMLQSLSQFKVIMCETEPFMTVHLHTDCRVVSSVDH